MDQLPGGRGSVCAVDGAGGGDTQLLGQTVRRDEGQDGKPGQDEGIVQHLQRLTRLTFLQTTLLLLIGLQYLHINIKNIPLGGAGLVFKLQIYK